MDDMTRFENRFEERIRAFAKTGVQSVDSAAVARAAAVGQPKTAASEPDQRRRLDEIRRPPRSISRSTFAAAAVVAMLAVGGALFVVAGDPSPTPSAGPSPSLPGVVAPSGGDPSEPAPSAEPTASAATRSTGAWIATGTMGTPRYGHTAVRLLDGRVLVAGGANGDENDTSAELYDPDSGTWSATGNMVNPSGGFPATLLRDGKVLVGDVDDPRGGRRDHRRRGVRPGNRDLDRHWEVVTPTMGAPDGHIAGRRQGARDGFRRAELYDPDTPVQRRGLYDPNKGQGTWSARDAGCTAPGNTPVGVLTSSSTGSALMLRISPWTRNVPPGMGGSTLAHMRLPGQIGRGRKRGIAARRHPRICPLGCFDMTNPHRAAPLGPR